MIAALLAERPGPRDCHHAPAIPGCTASRHAPDCRDPPTARKARVHAVGRRSRPMPAPNRQLYERVAGKDWLRTGRKIRQRLERDEGQLSRPVSRGGGGSNASLLPRPWVDANQQIEGPEKHHKSSGLLASLIVTLFTLWVYIMVVLTSLCPSNS